MAPIYIQTGGAGAQLGGGLGAGFSKGVADAMEQQRREQTARMEADLREEAAVADQGRREEAAVADQGRALERIKLGADLDAEAREDRQQFEVGQQVMADAAAKQERLTALDGSRNVALTRLNRQLEGLGEDDGGADPYLASRRGIIERAIAGVQGASTIGELSGFMVDLDAALGEIDIDEDMEGYRGLLGALTEESLAAQTQQGPGLEPPQPTPEMVALEAAINANDVGAAAQAAMAIVSQRQEEAKQMAAIQMSQAGMAQLQEAVLGMQPGTHIQSDDDTREFRAAVDALAADLSAQIQTEQLFSRIMGLAYRPAEALARVQSMVTGWIDPKARRLAREADMREEAQRAGMIAQAEETEKAVASGQMTREQANLNDPNYRMSEEEALITAGQLNARGDHLGAYKILARHGLLEGEE